MSMTSGPIVPWWTGSSMVLAVDVQSCLGTCHFEHLLQSFAPFPRRAGPASIMNCYAHPFWLVGRNRNAAMQESCAAVANCYRISGSPASPTKVIARSGMSIATAGYFPCLSDSAAWSASRARLSSRPSTASTSKTGGRSQSPVSAARNGCATLPSFRPFAVGMRADRRFRRGRAPLVKRPRAQATARR